MTKDEFFTAYIKTHHKTHGLPEMMEDIENAWEVIDGMQRAAEPNAGPKLWIYPSKITTEDVACWAARENRLRDELTEHEKMCRDDVLRHSNTRQDGVKS